jgi:Ca-activated chloride channel family protein
MLRFAAPWLLSILVPALLAVWSLARRRRRADARLVMPLAAERIRQAVSPWVRIERLVPWIRALALLLLVVSMARPQAGSRIESVSTYGVDIVVVLDTSGSMRAEDFVPKNRLEVARRTVEEFVDGRPNDRVGLVVFAGLAMTRCPVTLDHAMLKQFLAEVDFAPREQDGTALGMGLATGVNRLRESDARSKVVVLVTDGVNNRGQIGPEAAAEAARALGIKVYTVGVGSEGEVRVPVDLGPRGTRYVMQRVELDEDLLKQIAATTEGRYFRATDAKGLQQVFETIDELEKTEIESRVRVLYSELFPLTLLPAVALLMLERLLLGTRLRRIP